MNKELKICYYSLKSWINDKLLIYFDKNEWELEEIFINYTRQNEKDSSI